MYPVLFKIGYITIYTYGVFIASAFLLATFLAAMEGKRVGIDPQKIHDICFYILLSAIVGSRALFVIVNYKDFTNNPLKIIAIWEGGLVFYGGMVMAVGVVIYYLKRNKMDIWKTADVLAPFAAVGQAVGRWGCFFAGCCYGRPTSLPWGITFTNKLSLAPIGIPLHPAQIYSSINGIIIFIILMRLRLRKRFNGQIFWSYGILYSILRYILELFRGDERGYVIKNLVSTSQFISILFFITSIYMLRLLSQRKSEN